MSSTHSSSFYITLPSNGSGSIYPDNTSSQFRNRLSAPLDLRDGSRRRWWTALTELSIDKGQRIVGENERLRIAYLRYKPEYKDVERVSLRQPTPGYADLAAKKKEQEGTITQQKPIVQPPTEPNIFPVSAAGGNAEDIGRESETLIVDREYLKPVNWSNRYFDLKWSESKQRYTIRVNLFDHRIDLRFDVAVETGFSLDPDKNVVIQYHEGKKTAPYPVLLKWLEMSKTKSHIVWNVSVSHISYWYINRERTIDLEITHGAYTKLSDIVGEIQRKLKEVVTTEDIKLVENPITGRLEWKIKPLLGWTSLAQQWMVAEVSKYPTEYFLQQWFRTNPLLPGLLYDMTLDGFYFPALVMMGKLAEMLGFPNHALIQTTQSKAMPEVQTGSSMIYIYSNVIEPIMVGHQQVPLLRTLIYPYQNKDQIISYIFPRPYYIPVTAETLTDIEILLCNDQGKQMVFNEGSSNVITVATLHFQLL